MSSALGVLSRCQKMLVFIILASVAQAQLLGGAGTSSGFGSTSVLPPRMSSSFLHGIFNVQQVGPMTVRRSALLATKHEASALKEVCAQGLLYCFLCIFVACYEALCWGAPGQQRSRLCMLLCHAASCVTKGQTLRRGACAAFVNYFVGNSQCGSSGQTFANAVRNAPQPSAE